MHFRLTIKIIGLLLMVFSLSMLPSVLVSFIHQDGIHNAFILAFLLTLVSGFALWLPLKNHRAELRTRDGFVITVFFWSVLGLAGSVPILLAPDNINGFTDAFFESFSGLTTTGATVIVGLDALPKSLLFYRQQLQWMGGMGIIVLAVAVLPMLGIGGMQLYRAETPGPMKDAKLTPRIAETAKALWTIYFLLTLACALAYWAAGMSLFDAIGHSFSTIAIGGFSTHDASMAYFDSPLIESIAVFFMLLSAANFALHFVAWRHLSLSHYLKDPEYRSFLLILLALFVLLALLLFATQTLTLFDAFRYALFQSVSIMTTTGFNAADFASWPLFAPFMLILASFIGGCAGSTAGGIKVIRSMLVMKQGLREIIRLIHPQGVFPLKIGVRPVNDRVIEAVWGFVSMYILVYTLILFGLLATGLDFLTSWSAVAASLNNLGPGLGAVSENYADIPSVAKWLLCVAMLLGRLEVFTLLVIFSPHFWRN